MNLLPFLVLAVAVEPPPVAVRRPRNFPLVILAEDVATARKIWAGKGSPDAEKIPPPGFTVRGSGIDLTWIQSSLITPPSLNEAILLVRDLQTKKGERFNAKDLSLEQRKTFTRLIGLTALGRSRGGVEEAASAVEYMLEPTLEVEFDDGTSATVSPWAIWSGQGQGGEEMNPAEDRAVETPFEPDWSSDSFHLSFSPGFPRALMPAKAKETFELLSAERNQAARPLYDAVRGWVQAEVAAAIGERGEGNRFDLEPGTPGNNIDRRLLYPPPKANARIKSVGMNLTIGYRRHGSDTMRAADLFSAWR